MNKEVFKIKHICDCCPCLSTDKEEPGECNLGFTSVLSWVHKVDNRDTTVEDTAEMRTHQNDFDLMYVSPDCELEGIVLQAEVLFPKKPNT